MQISAVLLVLSNIIGRSFLQKDVIQKLLLSLHDHLAFVAGNDFNFY